MSEVRLIDANAIISFVDAGHLRNPLELAWSDKDVVDMIESRPTVDAVPVVRCKDCIWRHDDSSPMWLPCMERETPDDWFCADGERKEKR